MDSVLTPFDPGIVFLVGLQDGRDIGWAQTRGLPGPTQPACDMGIAPGKARGRTPNGRCPRRARQGISVAVVAEWVAPEVYVIDLGELNDRVVACAPIAPGRQRRMAHSRRPPPGYVESFRPNVVMQQVQLRALPRDPPLTAD